MKKNVLLISFAMFVCVGFTKAQSKDEQEITALVEVLDKAIINSDSSSLSAISLPELTYGHSSGKVENRAEFIATVLRGPIRILSIELSDQRLIISGNDAIVRHNFSAKITNNSTPGELKIGVVQMWKKQKGQWYLLARQGYKI